MTALKQAWLILDSFSRSVTTAMFSRDVRECLDAQCQQVYEAIIELECAQCPNPWTVLVEGGLSADRLCHACAQTYEPPARFHGPDEHYEEGK